MVTIVPSIRRSRVQDPSCPPRPPSFGADSGIQQTSTVGRLPALAQRFSPATETCPRSLDKTSRSRRSVSPIPNPNHGPRRQLRPNVRGRVKLRRWARAPVPQQNLSGILTVFLSARLRSSSLASATYRRTSPSDSTVSSGLRASRGRAWRCASAWTCVRCSGGGGARSPAAARCSRSSG